MDPRRHYSRSDVAGEIAEFLRGRWAGVYLESGSWLRWGDNGRPLRIESPEDVVGLASRGARSFYGTIEVFRRLESEEDVFELYEENVLGASSFIDIDILEEDSVEEYWLPALEAARLLSSWIAERIGSENVYLLWSGAGVHVRVPWTALEGVDYEGKRVDPIAVAYLLAEYALRENRSGLERIVRESGGMVKVENVVGRKRLFTAPLSLHKRLDRVAVAFKQEDAGLFTLSWTQPFSYRHDPEAWRRAVRGAARGLVLEALEKFQGRLPERTVIGVEARAPAAARRASARVPARIGRFPVMALLQAARYYVLNGDIEKAKSFGLNRAIFYAWAKYYGPAKSAYKRMMNQSAAKYSSRYGGRRTSRAELKPVPGMEEEAPMSSEGWFVMGGIEQRPEDFDRNVARRFEEAGIPFEEAWRAAVEYVSRFPPRVLRDPRLFYEKVYLPVRDSFVEKVLRGEASKLYQYRSKPPVLGRGEKRGSEAPKQRSLLDWIKDSGGEGGSSGKG